MIWCRLADGYMAHPKMSMLMIGDSIFNRLNFVRLLIQVEKPPQDVEQEAVEEIDKLACFINSTEEQNNVVIDYFLGMYRNN